MNERDQKLVVEQSTSHVHIFAHDVFGEIRSVVINGKPYFAGIDVARALGYALPHKAISDHCKGVLTWNIPTQSGVQKMLIIPEGDVYRLIVKAADQSRNKQIKAKAEEFERWLFDVVLPTIREHGVYMTDATIEKALSDPDFLIKLATQLKEERRRRQDAERQIAEMKPKADYFDALVERNLLTNFRDTAKELGMRPREFIDWLLKHKYIYRDVRGDLRPYAQYVPGLFEIKEWTRNGTAGVQTLVTPKGRETFRLLIQGVAGRRCAR